jgi:hypothetical protein
MGGFKAHRAEGFFHDLQSFQPFLRSVYVIAESHDKTGFG